MSASWRAHQIGVGINEGVAGLPWRRREAVGPRCDAARHRRQLWPQLQGRVGNAWRSCNAAVQSSGAPPLQGSWAVHGHAMREQTAA